MKTLDDVENCWNCRKAPGVVQGRGITFCHDCIQSFKTQLAMPGQHLKTKTTCSMCYEILPVSDGHGAMLLEHPDFTICEICVEVMVKRYCESAQT